MTTTHFEEQLSFFFLFAPLRPNELLLSYELSGSPTKCV